MLTVLPWPSSQITAVISAHNDNTKAYNLTAIVASLNSPMDFSMYIQNFTHRVSRAESGRAYTYQHARSAGLLLLECPFCLATWALQGCWCGPMPVVNSRVFSWSSSSHKQNSISKALRYEQCSWRLMHSY
jgi:hypothetical protein